MQYTRPQIASIRKASSTISSAQLKMDGPTDNLVITPNVSGPTYEADE